MGKDMWLDAIWQAPPGVKAKVSTRALGTLPSHPDWPGPLNLLTQIHSNTVQRAPLKIDCQIGDALFSREPNVVLGVKTADCLPILLTHQNEPWIAAVHAGWKGLYHEIICKVLEHAPEDRSKITAWIGPHIHQESYEVDEKFMTRFLEKMPDLGYCFKSDNGQTFCSLLEIAQHQLAQCGVSNIALSPYCTAQDNHQFFSHRQGDDGRLLTCIWLEK